MTAVAFLTLAEAASAVAGAIHPSEGAEAVREQVSSRYRYIITDAASDGHLIARDAETRMPLKGTGLARNLAIHVAVFSSRDLDAWLDSVGVGVTVVTNSLITSAVPAMAESGEDRQNRLRARRVTLKREGIRSFNKRIAKEEGISVGRVKQILAKAAPDSDIPGTRPLALWCPSKR